MQTITTCHISWIDFSKIHNYNYQIINDYVHFDRLLTVKEFNYITNTK